VGAGEIHKTLTMSGKKTKVDKIQDPLGRSYLTTRDVIMIETIQSLLEEPARRRCWLPHKALGRLPLDRAIKLARTTDEFVTGSRSESARCEAPVRLASGVLPRFGDEQPPSTGPRTAEKPS